MLHILLYILVDGPEKKSIVFATKMEWKLFYIRNYIKSFEDKKHNVIYRLVRLAIALSRFSPFNLYCSVLFFLKMLVYQRSLALLLVTIDFEHDLLQHMSFLEWSLFSLYQSMLSPKSHPDFCELSMPRQELKVTAVFRVCYFEYSLWQLLVEQEHKKAYLQMKAHNYYQDTKTAMGRSGGAWFSAQTIPITVLVDPLHKPTDGHRFIINITFAPLEIKIDGCIPNISWGIKHLASLLECRAWILQLLYLT